jgi:hypothetical protein
MSSSKNLASAAAALLAPVGLSAAQRSHDVPSAPGGPPADRFALMGLVANPALAGGDGDLILNLYAWVTEDGTGLGLMSDPIHPEVASDLKVHRVERHGSQYVITGEVTRSNNPRLIGQPFVLSAAVQGTAASPLELGLMGETFSGRGLVVIAIIAILLPLLVPAITKP